MAFVINCYEFQVTIFQKTFLTGLRGKNLQHPIQSSRKQAMLRATVSQKRFYHHVDLVLGDRKVWVFFLPFPPLRQGGGGMDNGVGTWEGTSNHTTSVWVFTLFFTKVAHHRMGLK